MTKESSSIEHLEKWEKFSMNLKANLSKRKQFDVDIWHLKFLWKTFDNKKINFRKISQRFVSYIFFQLKRNLRIFY